MILIKKMVKKRGKKTNKTKKINLILKKVNFVTQSSYNHMF